MIKMETFLQDAANYPTRVDKRTELGRFFQPGWRTIEEEEIEEAIEPGEEEAPVQLDADDEGRSKKVTVVKKIVAAKEHWLSTGLHTLLPNGEETEDLAEAVKDAMMTAASKQLSPESVVSLKKAVGGPMILRTVWPWMTFDSKSRSKLFPPIIEAAIQETVLTREYREPLLAKCSAAQFLRDRLAEIFTANSSLPFEWADGIVRRTPSAQGPGEDEALNDIGAVISQCTPSAEEPGKGALNDLSAVMSQLEDAKALAKDQKEIAKLIRTVESHRLAQYRKARPKERAFDLPVVSNIGIVLDMLRDVSHSG
jgi:hypothetical protein